LAQSKLQVVHFVFNPGPFWFGSNQWLNWLWLTRLRKSIPRSQQLVLVLRCPLKHELFDS
jgi:hypothetical protein